MARVKLDPRLCEACKRYFARARCFKMDSGDPCPCPKCTGICECYTKATQAQHKDGGK